VTRLFRRSWNSALSMTIWSSAMIAVREKKPPGGLTGGEAVVEKRERATRESREG
jgi:hypothetical protein